MIDAPNKPCANCERTVQIKMGDLLYLASLAESAAILVNPGVSDLITAETYVVTVAMLEKGAAESLNVAAKLIAQHHPESEGPCAPASAEPSSSPG